MLEHIKDLVKLLAQIEVQKYLSDAKRKKRPKKERKQ